MLRPFSSLLLVLLPAVVWSCSGSSGDSGGGGKGASAGTAGSTAATGGNAGSGTGGSGTSGSSTGGTSGASTGGTAGSVQGGTSGAATGGSAGAGAGGSSGKGGNSSTACTMDDDCVIAQTYSTAGCCSRGCGFALNGDWVANEPCATADPMADPVPTSCSAGCQLCPQDLRCEILHGAVCVNGTCTEVRTNGPCATDDDCVIGIDYETTLGACCNCSVAASKEALEHDSCIVPFGEPKPNGCDVTPPNACDTAGCPGTCAQPTTRCMNGRCGG